jgi:signal transduction histidine kinase
MTAAPGLSMAVRLHPHPACVAQARRRARESMCRWGLPGHAHLAQLIVSELATNALRHGSGPIEVRLSCAGGDLCIQVHDDGQGRPVRRETTIEDESGRGLAVLDHLLGEHGGVRGIREDRDGPGKTVYVIITIAADLAGGR